MNVEHKQLIKRYSNNRVRNELKRLIEGRIVDFVETGDRLSLYITNGLYTFNTIIITQMNNDKMYVEFLGDGVIRHLHFTISRLYPFQPPDIRVNQHSYLSLLHFNREHRKLLGFGSNKCLCCESLTCSNNWGPSCTLDTLIKEVYRNMEYKRVLTYQICVDAIKYKYLNPDIPIMEFLLPIL